jgi:hypothetical protein
MWSTSGFFDVDDRLKRLSDLAGPIILHASSSSTSIDALFSLIAMSGT